METIKPKSLKEFLELFNTYTNIGNDYYRGQADRFTEAHIFKGDNYIQAKSAAGINLNFLIK